MRTRTEREMSRGQGAPDRWKCSAQSKPQVARSRTRTMGAGSQSLCERARRGERTGEGLHTHTGTRPQRTCQRTRARVRAHTHTKCRAYEKRTPLRPRSGNHHPRSHIQKWQCCHRHRRLWRACVKNTPHTNLLWQPHAKAFNRVRRRKPLLRCWTHLPVAVLTMPPPTVAAAPDAVFHLPPATVVSLHVHSCKSAEANNHASGT